MKKIFFLFVLVPFFCPAQDIPKFSNAIIAKGVAFKQIKDSLLQRGYFIDQQNEQDGTIITKPKGVCNCKNVDFNQLIIEVYIKDSSARFTGRWNLNYNNNASRSGFFSNDKNEFHKLEYWKSSISTPHYIFLVLDKFVRVLTQDVTYAKL